MNRTFYYFINVNVDKTLNYIYEACHSFKALSTRLLYYSVQPQSDLSGPAWCFVAWGSTKPCPHRPSSKSSTLYRETGSGALLQWNFAIIFICGAQIDYITLCVQLSRGCDIVISFLRFCVKINVNKKGAFIFKNPKSFKNLSYIK